MERVVAEDDLVPLRRVAAVLDADVVLVGEEIGDLVIDHVPPEHRPRGDRALVEGVGPVLDADPAAVEGVPGAGHVASREDARRARLQVLVDRNSALELEPRPLRLLDPRRVAPMSLAWLLVAVLIVTMLAWAATLFLRRSGAN